MPTTARTCWIGVVSREHVRLGVKGGYVQLNHGRKAPVQRLEQGDGIVLYSPRTSYPNGDPLQALTAIGTVLTGEVYQVEMSPDFKPYRVNVAFVECKEAPIKPLLGKLSFIKDKTHWGASFRFGSIRIPADDFGIIARAMGAEQLARQGL